jgi:hypothetical protein
MSQFVVSKQFKTRVSEILSTKKFSAVFPFMNLIKREGDVYPEAELNQLVQFIAEFPYSEVSEFFSLMPELVKPFNPAEASEESAHEADPNPEVTDESIA